MNGVFIGTGNGSEPSHYLNKCRFIIGNRNLRNNLKSMLEAFHRRKCISKCHMQNVRGPCGYLSMLGLKSIHVSVKRAIGVFSSWNTDILCKTTCAPAAEHCWNSRRWYLAWLWASLSPRQSDWGIDDQVRTHYIDVMMGAVASQITSLTIVYSIVYSGVDQQKTSKLRVTGLLEGNSPVTGEFSAQRASNAEDNSIWWRHHVRWASIQPVWCHCRNRITGSRDIHQWLGPVTTKWIMFWNGFERGDFNKGVLTISHCWRHA